MSRFALRTIVVVCLVLLAGCAGDGQTTTSTSTTAATSDTSTTMAPTTTAQTTTVVRADSVPFSLENTDNESHTIHLLINNESNVIYNDTITLDADSKQHVTTFTGQGNTYYVVATMDNASFEKNVPLNAGLLRSGITINESGQFEYSYLIH